MKIGIIGGGAAGMVAAITAAKAGADVTVLEKNDRVGKKILATGNGKCNLGNLDFGTDKYYCSDKEKLGKMFRVFAQWDTINFFEEAGLLIREKDGYLYPYCEQASAVLDVLRMALIKMGVTVVTDFAVKKAYYEEKRQCFVIIGGEGKKQYFDKLILACGSPASLKKGEGRTGYELAKGFGHRVSGLVPGLCGLRSDENFIKALAGVRSKAEITLIVDGKEAAFEAGEVQFTDYGVSGIPVFQISRLAAYACQKGRRVHLKVDFYPDTTQEQYTRMAKLRYETMGEKTMEDFLTGTLNKKINMVMIKQTDCKPGMTVKETGWKKIRELFELCRNFSIHITEPGCMENAQVCAGGVDFGQITAQMESKLVKGLYFAGELMDVDGKCGGYNLQWAWTSGYIAGRNAAGCSTEKIANEAEGSKAC